VDARPTEEQRALAAAVGRAASDLAPASTAELPAAGAGADGWRVRAEMGLSGMRVPEAAGGTALSGVEVAIAAEELGKNLVPLPFLGSAVLATEILRAAGAGNEVLASLAGGTLRLAPVLDPTLARPAAPGEEGIAWDARGADAGLVFPGPGEPPVAVCLGERLSKAADLTRDLRAVEAGAERVDVGNLGSPLSAEAFDRVLALSLAALAADLVGVVQAALDSAVAHVGERVQFDAPVGSFQAVQHMAAEAHVSVEAARGLAWYAGWAVDALEPRAALLAARTAKAYCSQRGRQVAETAMQMLGGVAFTWEHMAHVRTRRALLDRQILGDEHAQLAAIAAARAADGRLASGEAR